MVSLSPTDFEGLTRLTQALVRTPSLPGQERQAAGLLQQAMMGCGFHRVWVDEVGNVIGHFRGAGPGPTLLFDGHMDTVDVGEPSAWKHGPYAGEIDDGILYGRGSADMKAALAAMLYGVKLLAEGNAPLRGDVFVALVVQEEPCEGVAIRHLIEQEGIQPDIVVLGEPTNLGVSLGQRGRIELKVSTFGKASHAAMPQGGINAITAAARLVFGIDLLASQLHHDPQLGPGSIAVTQITSQAGSLNSIPDLCQLTIDRRLTLGETEARAIAELQSVINRERIRAEVMTTEYEMTTYAGFVARGRNYFPPWLLSDEDPLARKVVRAVEKVLGIRPRTSTWSFSTDGAYTMGTAGIPTIGFGPGEEHRAHTVDECVRLVDVAEAARGYAQIAVDLLR